MAKTVKATVNRDFVTGRVSDMMFGQYFEPIGRCTHEGMYEPDHPTANAKGWRQDVLELVRDLNITCFRYPGGNLTASYRWEDGVGPREKRPARMELAWVSIEDNSIGTNEYIEYVKDLGAETLMTFNMGTRGVESAVDLVEYCNYPGGTWLSDLRRAHGYEKPHNIRYWCLGNEVEGEWQIAQHRAEDYGWLCRQTAKAVKRMDPSYQLIAAGSSNCNLPTYIDWDLRILDDAYEYIDGLAIHCYTDRRETDTTLRYLAHTVNLEQYLSSIEGVCRAVKAKKRGRKDIWLSIDEWNVQSYEMIHLQADRPKRGIRPWMVHPPIIEQTYTMEDALALGLQFIVYFRHCNSIKVACMSLLVNCLSPIMTEKGGPAWKQPTYYPFMHCSKYGRGRVLETIVDGECYQDDLYGKVPYVEGIMIQNEGDTLTLFAVNKHGDECTCLCGLQGFEDYRIIEHIVLSHEDLFAVNTVKDQDNVKPHNREGGVISDGELRVTLEAYSWNVVRMQKGV
ncbi:MAG: alpha-N-arabinofuranosidase [Treponema sp.]|jgi:alpha-N-arabinofuranosidase|nr:alpha-N-arabinofuranosidase [Treponema sp.]